MEDKDLGFHDDNLLSVLIEPDEQRAVLTIQTHRWIECVDPNLLNPGGKTFRAEKDKVVKITLELSENQPYFKGDLGTIYPFNDIFEIGVKDNVLHVSLIMGLLEFHIDSYEVVI